MLPLAQRYRDFLQSIFTGLEEVAPLPPLMEDRTELDVQSLWFAGEFGSDFTTTDGSQVTIRDFGTWNHASGPDFTGCAIEHEGKVLRGDIELDPDVRDWEHHGHGANPAYENVVLHLYTEAPAERVFTRTAQHREVLQVLIMPEMLPDQAKPRWLAEARLGRCATPLKVMRESQVTSLLESAAQYRLQKKAEKLAALVRIHGREQAVYQSLANALGYRNNQRPFTVLAQRLPVKEMLKHDALVREALLYGVSGFLEGVDYEDTEPDTRLYLRGLWSEWWKQREAYADWLLPPHEIVWKISGNRPGNHSQRRLGALSAMLQGWSQVYGLLKDAKSWSRKEFTKVLPKLKHEHWDTHYTLLAAPSEKPIALVGKTRVQEILANVVYPLLAPEDANLWHEYLQLPALLDNQKVRRASLRLFGEEPAAAAMYQKRLFHQQGLIQIYEDYCMKDDSACEGCPFPEQLKQWA